MTDQPEPEPDRPTFDPFWWPQHQAWLGPDKLDPEPHTSRLYVDTEGPA